MTSRYTYATTLASSTGTVPEVDEIEVEVSYTVAWGSPGTGRPYYGPPELYDEGSDSEVENLTLLSVNGAAKPETGDNFAMAANQEMEAEILQEIAQNHAEAMLEAARDWEAYWAEDAADYRREARL